MQVESLGWKIAEREKILEKTLDDKDFLVKTLRSDVGRRFMRKISGEKLAYDQLDRAATMPGGQPMIFELIRTPDADRVFRPGNLVQLADLAHQIPVAERSKSPRPQDFSKPTGRIYTAETLVKVLKLVYQRELTRRESKQLP
jgi:hypothetical protein